MSSMFTTLRTAVSTAAKTVVPFDSHTSQVVIGNYNWAASTDFFANIVTSTPWLFILPTSGEASGYTFNGTFQFHADMVYGFANDTVYTWTAIEDIIGLLLKAWAQAYELVRGSANGSLQLTWAEPEVRSDLKPVVARTRFTFVFPFIADQA